MTGMAKLLGLVLAALLCIACSRVEGGSGVGLLKGKKPDQSVGFQRPHVLTDGAAAKAGDPWNSQLSSTFGPGGSARWDLGEVRTLRSAYVQGDNNDEYVISVSEDGESWTELWRAQPTGGRGLQSRSVGDLEARARYVRLSAGRGDSSFAVSELAVLEDAAPPADSAFRIKRGMPITEVHRSAILLFGLALVLFVVVAQRGSRWLTLAALVLPIVAGWRLFESFQLAWPVGQREISMVRATAAFVALAALAREAFASRRFPASRPAVIGTLGVAAVLAMAGFFNLGYPQFWDAKNARPNVVHNHDMRVYYPVAKYFRELHFDGVYLASVAAYVDDQPAQTLDNLAHVQIRDLRTHHMRRVGEVKHEIEAVRTRFTPERWQSFVEDMRYFRETMGDRGYLDSLTDHGGNATPVWIAIGHLIFAKTTATNTTLILTGLLDPLLLLVAFLAIWRTFGVRTMLVSMAVFGANDFYMFGSNWAFATLRHDWMVYLALGACALKREKWMLGGALLALAAMIRAFPAFALIGAAMPTGWWLYQHWRAHKRLPKLAELRVAQAPILKIALGAILCVAAFFLFSSALFSVGTWGEWLQKVSILDRDPHTNHVSLRGLVAGNDAMHMNTLNARMPLFVALAATFSGLIIAATRGKSPARAAMLGTLLIPIAFNPANYYIHFIFVLPLLAIEKSRAERAHEHASPIALRDFLIWAILLGVCVLQYWTVLIQDWGLHFQLATVILFAGVAALLIVIVAFDWRALRAEELGSGAQLALPFDAVPAVEPAAPAGAEPAKQDEAAPEQPETVADSDSPARASSR
jgi:hypothetical protein